VTTVTKWEFNSKKELAFAENRPKLKITT